ncbi:ribonuclease YeeF family protein [Fictibacillus gelatini]|uniref:ribonuclease YeeF family protein n=1 Tax=Fictibacillus gelatini TaxID=225985 RepID=UPI00041A589F|nr:LXG domain-containing protein [Fictibacillus gelatini]
MKRLDVQGFRSGIDDILHHLRTLDEQMKQIKDDMNGIIGLEDALKGKGGQSIRSFYQECHGTFLLFFEGFLTNYKSILRTMKRELQSLEPAEDGFIDEEFLEHHLEQGLKKIESVTIELTDEANRIMKSVNDIVDLPQIQDEGVLSEIHQARKKKRQTLEQLYRFDYVQTNALNSVEQDIETMSRYLKQMESMFQTGQNVIENFSSNLLLKNDAYAALKKGIEERNGRVSPQELPSSFLYPKTIMLPDPGQILADWLNEYRMRASGYKFRVWAFTNTGVPSDKIGSGTTTSVSFEPFNEQNNRYSLSNERQKYISEWLQALGTPRERYFETGDDEGNSNEVDYVNRRPDFSDKLKVMGNPNSKLAGDMFTLGDIAAGVGGFWISDVETMFDENASFEDRALSTVFTLVKPAKLVEKGYDSVKIGRRVRKGTEKTVDDLIQGAKPIKDKGVATIYDKTGGYSKAVKEFETLKPVKVKEIINKKTGQVIGKRGQITIDGKNVNINVRMKSSHDNRPTIEIIIDKYDRVKIRY